MRAGWGALAAAAVVAAGAALPALCTSNAAALKGPTRAGAKRATTQATAQPAPPANALKRWAATNGGGNAAQTPTLAQALAVATNYDLVLATKKSFPPYLAQMRQANPAMKIVAYLNGTYAQSDQGSAYPEGWYARAADGSKVRSKKFGNYLMDPTAAGWIQNRAQTCAQYAADSGYDGCYLDMLGNATMGGTYVTAPPVNNAGQQWTRAAWIGATSKLGTAAVNANPALQEDRRARMAEVMEAHPRQPGALNRGLEKLGHGGTVERCPERGTENKVRLGLPASGGL